MCVLVREIIFFVLLFFPLIKYIYKVFLSSSRFFYGVSKVLRVFKGFSGLFLGFSKDSSGCSSGFSSFSGVFHRKTLVKPPCFLGRSC